MTSQLPNNANNNRPPDPPRRNNRPGAVGALDLNSSNSTASLFLGAARKSWMSAATENNSHQPQRSNQNPPSVNPTPVSRSSTPSAACPPASPSPRADSSGPAAARSTVSASTPPLAAVSPCFPTRPAGMRNPSSHAEQNSISFRQNQGPVTPSAPAVPWNVARPQISPTSNTPPSLTRSPASYSQPLPRPAEARLHQQKQQQQQQQQHLQTHLEQRSVSSLPSPDPTIPPRSRTSPISAIERNGSVIASPSTSAFPSPPLHQVSANNLNQLRPNASAPASAPISQSLPNNPQGNPRSVRQANARTGPNTPNIPSHPPHAAHMSASVHPLPQQQTNGTLQTSPIDEYGSIITHEFFQRAKYNADVCAARAGQLVPTTDAVEMPRLQLLSYACQERDLVYLALHQIYCLSSLRPADLHSDFLRFTPKHMEGLEIVRNLLVDNSRVSEKFLSWCVDFPYSLSGLLRDRLFLDALEAVRRLLAGFVDCWAFLESVLRTQKHPPLVEDMVRSLGVMSVVLQYNIFLCLCRRIPNAKLESQLQDIFVKDLDYFKRSSIANISPEQRVHENNEILALYRRAVGSIQTHGGGPQGVASPAQGVPVPIHPPPSASEPTEIASNAQNTASYASPYAQPHPGTHGPNGGIPAALRNPVTGAPTGTSQWPSSRQSLIQQRGPEAQVSPLQVTGIVPPQVVATAPQPMTRPDMSQWHLVQQYALQTQQLGPQNVDRTGSPAQLAHVLAGGRIPSSNSQYATLQQPQNQRRLTSFLPPAGLPPVINTRPDPNRSALHQADLRDPVNQFFSISKSGEREQTELLPLLTSFAVGPKVLRQPERSFKWELTLSANEIKDCVSYEEQGPGKRLLRTAVDGSQLYRLRCIKVPRSTLELSEHSWCVAETTWPTAIYMQVNGKDVWPRRKHHNTRDLPLDITPYLQQELNHVKIGFVLGQAEQKDFTYAMALERLTLCNLALGKSLAQSLPADESQKRICGRLARNPGDEDDELSIVSDDLKINLVDPYTARLFEVPVRGAYCEHTECFDHETFLQTRILKFGDNSPVEAFWRCPVCRQDARPQNLVVDEFLANVRKELERTNRCEGARSLQIKADGSWEVNHDDDLSSERSTPQPPRPATKRKSTILENGVCQRPKLDRSVSTNDAASNQASAVIILE
ncbi:hypothetical protein BDV06DRAFT_72004 [Aspergillus oleicola]